VSREIRWPFWHMSDSIILAAGQIGNWNNLRRTRIAGCMVQAEPAARLALSAHDSPSGLFDGCRSINIHVCGQTCSPCLCRKSISATEIVASRPRRLRDWVSAAHKTSSTGKGLFTPNADLARCERCVISLSNGACVRPCDPRRCAWPKTAGFFASKAFFHRSRCCDSAAVRCRGPRMRHRIFCRRTPASAVKSSNCIEYPY
jgi:hypothetical protein